MAVKGFDIKIGADTNAFLRALREMDKPIKDAQKQIKGLNDSLKLDPTNVQVLTAKQQQLANQIKDTNDRLKFLNQEHQKYEDLLKTNGSLTTEQQRNFQRVNTEIAITQQQLKQLEKEYDNLGSVALQQIRVVGSNMEELGSKIESVGAKLSIVSAGVAGLFGTGINYNMGIEKAQRAFEVFTGSAEQAKEIVDNIRADSKKSIFDTSNLINANKLLVSSGVEANTARDAINNMADILALSGGGNDELNRMAYNLQQIANNGKATARDIKQFGDAGIPIYKMLSDTLGISTEKVKEMDISFDILAEAFEKATEEGGQFAHGQEIMASTTSGSMMIIKKKFEETLGALSQSLMPIVTEVMQKVIDFLDKLNENPALMSMITNIGLLLVALGPVTSIVGTLTKNIGGILKQLPSLQTMISAITSPVGLVVMGITALVLIFKHLYDTNEEFRESANRAWENVVAVIQNVVVPAFESFMEFAGTFLSSLWENLQNLWSKIEPFIQEALQFLLEWWNETGSEIVAVLGDLLGSLLNGINWLWQNVIDPVIKWVADKLFPVISFIMGSIGDVVKNVFGVISWVWDHIKGILEGIIDFIDGVFSGDWEKAWQGVGEIFEGVWNNIKEFGKTVINGIINVINNMLGGLNKIRIPDWVPRTWWQGNKYTYDTNA